MPAEANTLTGWQAELELGFSRRGPRTRLSHYRRQGPLHVQRPFYPEADGACQVYILHPPGGVVGGDILDIQIKLEANAQALLTTPAAGKFYRSQGAVARQTQQLQVAPGAELEWLPQETICYADAQVNMQTRVDLQGDARFIGWDILCLGRPAAGENFQRGRCRQRIEIWREGLPLYWEQGVYAGETLNAAWGLGGRPVLASLYCVTTEPGLLEATRAALPPVQADELAGVTQLDGVLISRYSGPSTERAWLMLSPVWQTLRRLLLGRPAQLPRVWST